MYRATGREQCQAPHSGLCALETKVPRGFREEAESLHCHDPGELKAFLGGTATLLAPCTPSPHSRGRNVAPPPALTSAAASPQLPSPPCRSPSASSLSRDRSCLLLLQQTEKGSCGLKGQCQNQSKDTLSLGGETAENLASRTTCSAETTSRLGAGCRS